MAEAGQFVGIDRCEGALQTTFALTLMELGKFEWRCANGHEWEVGRWPGLGLILLAQPECGPYRPHFAICPVPSTTNEVSFFLLLALGGTIERTFLNTGDASVTLFYLPLEQVRRDMVACAHRVFDAALWLQLPHLEATHMRKPPYRTILPCMRSLAKLQRPFTAPTGF